MAFVHDNANKTKIKEVHCQAKTPPTIYDSFDDTNNCKLYVPIGTREDYANAAEWKYFSDIIEETVISGDDNDDQCVAPTIDYVDGHLKFSSATPNATYVYTITDDDIKTSLEECTSGDVPLNATYNVVAYAIADGYSKSDATTKTIQLSRLGGADTHKAPRINIIEKSMISGDDDDNRCAAPTIEFVDGHLKFSCTTPNATYSYIITDEDIKNSFEESASGDIPLTATYNVLAFAKADGYETSNATTKTLQYGNYGAVDVDALKDQIRSLEAQNSALASENTKLKDDVKDLTTEVSNLKTKNADLKTENESLTKENSALESKNMDLAAKNSDLKDDVKTLESENSSLKETVKMYAEGDLNLDGRTNIDDVVYLLKMDSYSSDADALALLLDGSTAITLSEITDKYGDVEFYTLNGVKVNIPNQAGIYIVKKNGETKMVVVKK